MQECPRCGALYCDDHGEALCARCMDPALALPSYRIYRGSLLALLVGSVVAVWLLVLPPAGADQDGPPASLVGVIPTATATPTPTVTATATATPELTATAVPTPVEPTPVPTPTATATAEPRTYTVQPGDTLFAIAERFASSPDQVEALSNAIARVNNITDPATIQIGQVLTIPEQ